MQSREYNFVSEPRRDLMMMYVQMVLMAPMLFDMQ